RGGRGRGGRGGGGRSVAAGGEGGSLPRARRRRAAHRECGEGGGGKKTGAKVRASRPSTRWAPARTRNPSPIVLDRARPPAAPACAAAGAQGEDSGTSEERSSRSFPRKRESSAACSKFVMWVPAFAGTSG